MFSLLFASGCGQNAGTSRASRTVELTAMEPGGQDRRHFPLTVGVPFAKGVLAAGESVAITDEGGKPQPLQTRVLERHADGSTRWLLLDYQGDFTPFGANRSTLVLGGKSPEAPAGHRIQTAEQGTTLVVDNGVLKLELERKQCLPLARVWRAGKLVSSGGMDLWVTAPGGEKFSARDDTTSAFELEEAGPLRLVARWKGTHTSAGGKRHFDYLVRLAVYAGNPFVRVDHVFFNRLDPDVTEVKEVAARFPIQLEGPLQYTVGDLYRARLVSDSFKAFEPVRLEQYGLGDMRILGDGGKVLKGAVTAASGLGKTNSRGWVDASGASEGVLLAGKNFWQNYPKAISAGPEAFQCFLIPDRGRPFPVPRGMAKTHTFFLYFHAGKQGAVAQSD
ncbi:MAG: hypothetical protein DMG07_28420, partial [Acidobacteria bacterium]